MIRIKKTALIEDNNKFLYQYKAFTGLVFDIVDQQVLDVFECKDGIRIANYQRLFILRENNELCVDFEALVGEFEEEYDPFLYQGERYTGLYYEFENEFCVTEGRCIEGRRMEEVGWYETGDLEEFWTSYDEYPMHQTYEWYENGLLGKIYICEAEEHTLKIEFTEKQEVKIMSVSVDYLNKSPEFEHRLKYHYLIGYSFIEKARIALQLHLSDIGINDRLFSELQSSTGFSELEEITFFNTSVSTESLLSLINHQNLKKIRVVEDNRAEISLVMTELKLKRPSCCIELNNIEI